MSILDGGYSDYIEARESYNRIFAGGELVIIQRASFFG